MSHEEVESKLQNVFDAVFLEDVRVARELTANDVAEWDSLLHVSLVLAIEKEFGIRFRVGEVEAAKNVGQLIDLIAKRVDKS
jgi:acyl carrier protein